MCQKYKINKLDFGDAKRKMHFLMHNQLMVTLLIELLTEHSAGIQFFFFIDNFFIINKIYYLFYFDIYSYLFLAFQLLRLITIIAKYIYIYIYIYSNLTHYSQHKKKICKYESKVSSVQSKFCKRKKMRKRKKLMNMLFYQTQLTSRFFFFLVKCKSKTHLKHHQFTL